MWQFGFDMDEILPNLFLGNMSAARSKDMLTTHRVTHILTVADAILPAFPEDYKYKVISMIDSSSQNIIQHFKACLEFIHQAIQEGGCVLIHCAAGVSRSATITIAYLMWVNKWKAQDSQDFVRLKRNVIYPNGGFLKQLALFESMEFSFGLQHPLYLDWIERKEKDRENFYGVDIPWDVLTNNQPKNEQ